MSQEREMSQKIKITDDKELVSFHQLKYKVNELNLDNDTIIRFLRARDLDVNRAEEMIRHSVQWRLDNKISEYLNWKPSSPLFKLDLPLVCSGVDHEGDAVIYAPMGKWKLRERLELGLREDCEAFQCYTLENIMHHIKNSPGSQMVFVIDQEGLSYYNIAHMESLQIFFDAFKLFEQNYPEILKRAVIINASWLFTMLFTFVKPAFSGKTLSKVQVFSSSDREKCKKALLDLIPTEALPSNCKDI